MKIPPDAGGEVATSDCAYTECVVVGNKMLKMKTVKIAFPLDFNEKYLLEQTRYTPLLLS